ncbi:MAG: hypothetical protein ABSC23_00015 [Bryobacteraceae bacterium]|jgi:opacity protein-like surface antigen
MKSLARSTVWLAAAASACLGQQWEFGVNGGGSFVNSIPVTSPAGSATTGFQTGGAFGVFLAQNPYRHISGELRYGYIASQFAIHSGGSTATFAGNAQVVHYDVALHTASARAQVFVAFGGGVKVYQGTGVEAAYQPLMQYAYLTKTRQIEPMASVGAGVKYAITRKIFFRTEFRDYITPFPTQVIAPALNATFNGNWLHNIVPMAGLSFAF